MREAKEQDKEKILEYLQWGLADCIYIYIDIRNYGIETNNIKVWIDEKKRELCLVAMKYYDSLQIYSHDNACDIEPILSLMAENPVTMISGRKDIIKRLEKKCMNCRCTYGSVFIMDNFLNIWNKGEITEATVLDTPEIASLICADEEIGGHYTLEGLQKQLEERINTKTGRSYIIRLNDKIVAHSATYAETENIAVVGGTIIHPEYRNTNYYLILSNYMLQQLYIEKKKVYTFSISEKMIQYHRRLHTECGEYGKLIVSRIKL